MKTMNIIDTREKTIERANSFLNNLKSDDKIYLIGTNKYGLSLSKFLNDRNLNIKGFINDFSSELEYSEYKLYKSDSIKSSDIVINCVVEGRTIDVNKHIQSLNIRSTCDYFAIQLANKYDLLEINYLDDTSSIFEKINDYLEIYNLLNDEQSKLEFEAINNFRLNRDIHYLKDFKFKPNEQYFEEFINTSRIFSFVDGGSFDGATTEEFMKKQPLYANAYVFEPSLNSFNLLKNKFIGNSKIELFNKGLWNIETTLFFNSSLGNASKIEQDGEEKIETMKLDNIIDNKIDFIKLDIEGAEIEALDGAVNTIKKNKPTIAVCVYHNQSDFISIPKKLISIHPDYKILLRHYTQGVCETVMYFIP
jgi:FkbM family methyltransferase